MPDCTSESMRPQAPRQAGCGGGSKHKLPPPPGYFSVVEDPASRLASLSPSTPRSVGLAACCLAAMALHPRAEASGWAWRRQLRCTAATLIQTGLAGPHGAAAALTESSGSQRPRMLKRRGWRSGGQAEVRDSRLIDERGRCSCCCCCCTSSPPARCLQPGCSFETIANAPLVLGCLAVARASPTLRLAAFAFPAHRVSVRPRLITYIWICLSFPSPPLPSISSPCSPLRPPGLYIESSLRSLIILFGASCFEPSPSTVEPPAV